MSFLMAPVDAGHILFTALKDGSVDLADIALMNDSLTVKAENQRRAQVAADAERGMRGGR